jgi:nucleotide-binding universal stress UspA family protein
MTAAERDVLVGNDGSDEGFRAVRWAADQASRLGTKLHIVHTWLWPLFKVDLGAPANAPTGAGLQAQAEAVLADSERHAHEVAPEMAVRTSLVTGDAAAQLLRLSGDAAAQLLRLSGDAGMLVVGSRGLGGFAGLLLGSVGVEVSAHAVCPVVVVRGRSSPSGPVVVGIDHSEQSAAAALAAAREARRRRSELVVLHAWEPPLRGQGTAPVGWKELAEAGQRAGRELLARIQASVAEHEPNVMVRPRLGDGSATAELVTASSSAQLVVVGSRGVGALRGLLLGSTTHALIHHANCPVLVHR